MASKKRQILRKWEFVWPLLIGSLLSTALFVCRIIGSGGYRYWFLMWNLFLAWLPLIFAHALYRWLERGRWVSWQGITLSALWLGFLPNSFYLVTDFIHLHATGEVSLLFDAVMFMSFAWNGLILGFMSVLLIHSELQKRLRPRAVLIGLGIVFLLCSLAIYLGRYLAWNTWDILINPAGIIFDLSNRITSPRSYPNTFTTTSTFFILLTSLYFSFFRLLQAVRRYKG